MSAHGSIPKPTWTFPLLGALLYAGVATTHYVILFGTVFAAVHTRK